MSQAISTSRSQSERPCRGSLFVFVTLNPRRLPGTGRQGPYPSMVFPEGVSRGLLTAQSAPAVRIAAASVTDGNTLGAQQRAATTYHRAQNLIQSTRRSVDSPRQVRPILKGAVAAPQTPHSSEIAALHHRKSLDPGWQTSPNLGNIRQGRTDRPGPAGDARFEAGTSSAAASARPPACCPISVGLCTTSASRSRQGAVPPKGPRGTPCRSPPSPAPAGCPTRRTLQLPRRRTRAAPPPPASPG